MESLKYLSNSFSKTVMKKTSINKPIILGILSLLALYGFAKPKRVLQIFRNGEVIQEYAVSEIDYIEINEISDLEGSQYEYIVKSKDISKSGIFGGGFYYKNFWDEGITLNYSVSEVKCFQQLGNSMNIEIYAGSHELYNGKEFNVAETDYPFSFKFQYVDTSIGNTVDVIIDNNNREGATGTITLIRNSTGSYDAIFDVTMDAGDVMVKGYYAGDLHDRNEIYSSTDGIIASVKSATLDLSGNPCILYLSTKGGMAGPDNYDIKGEVPADEWEFDKYMAFSGQGSSITWLDGAVYDKNSYETSPVIGGNWRVMSPFSVPGGKKVAECTSILFGENMRYAYYLGEIQIIE